MLIISDYLCVYFCSSYLIIFFMIFDFLFWRHNNLKRNNLKTCDFCGKNKKKVIVNMFLCT